MAHNHWFASSEAQVVVTLGYSWAQYGGRWGCPDHSEQWGHASRYGSGARAEFSTVEQRLSILGGTGVGTKMETSIHLRAKDFAAHERWLANLADVITSNGLDDLWENQKIPTLEAVARQFTSNTPEQQQESHLYHLPVES